MVYPSILRFIFAAGLLFLTIFITAPIVYTFWFDNLRSTIPNTTYGHTMVSAGDGFFSSYKILGYVVPVLIIVWGFADSARKGAQTGYTGDVQLALVTLVRALLTWGLGGALFIIMTPILRSMLYSNGFWDNLPADMLAYGDALYSLWIAMLVFIPTVICIKAWREAEQRAVEG